MKNPLGDTDLPQVLGDQTRNREKAFGLQLCLSYVMSLKVAQLPVHDLSETSRSDSLNLSENWFFNC